MFGFKQKVDFKYLKWVSRRSSNSYYEKQSPKIWFEFQDDLYQGEYTEVSQIVNPMSGHLEITLRRSRDGFYFRLTNDSVLFNRNQSRVNTFQANGFWSLQTKKSEGILYETLGCKIKYYLLVIIL